MPLPPSRKDVTGPPPLDTSDLAYVVRHLSSASRQIDPGLLGGRAITPRPVPYGPSQLVGEDAGGDGEDVLGEDGDRLTLTSLGDQTWPLTYVPVPETLHIFFHPDGVDAGGVRWTRGVHYNIDDDTNLVTIASSVLADSMAEVDDVLSAQYLHLEEEDAPGALDSLVLRGASNTVLPGDTVPLDPSTEIGDLLVVGSAVMRSDGIPGLVVPVDSRLTRLSHNAWIGTVTNLDGVLFQDFGADDRFQGVVATFAAPASYISNAAVGPGADGFSPFTSPVVGATAAILIASTENPNGTGAFTSVPADWDVVSALTTGAVSTVQMWSWIEVDTLGSPAGDLDYLVHVPGGFAYATVIGLGAD